MPRHAVNKFSLAKVIELFTNDIIEDISFLTSF